MTLLLSHSMVPFSFLFFLIFNNSIVTLDSTNIKSDFTFITFNGTLFFSHLTVPLSYWLVPTSLLTILLSYLVVAYFFLTVDSFIVTLDSTNITFDSTFTFEPTTDVIFLLNNNRSSQLQFVKKNYNSSIFLLLKAIKKK